jgi:hypothetical protein
MTRRSLPAPALVAAGVLLWAASAAAQPAVRLPAADRALAGRPAPAFTVDAGEMQVGAVAFDAADNLYVLDRAGPRVRVFDRAGRPVRQWGRRGTAGGDLLAPVRLAVTTDGMVVVSDAGRRAFVVYRADGTFVRALPFTGERLAGLEMAADARGGVVADARPLSMRGRLDGGGDGARLAVILRPTGEGAERTLYSAAEEAVHTGADAGPRPGSQLVGSAPPAFAPRLSWAPLPGGKLAVSHSARYAVRVLGPDGRVERVLERPFTPRAVTARDRDAERERMRAALARGEGATVIPVGNRGTVRIPQAVVEAQVEGMEFADVVPVVERVAADPRGRIWVQRTGAAPGRAGPIDLLSPEGRYLGTMAAQPLPDAFSPAGRAAYVEKGADGKTVVAVRTLPAWR